MLVTLPASGCGLFPEKVGYFTLKLPESGEMHVISDPVQRMVKLAAGAGR
jgi:hypothetical protein